MAYIASPNPEGPTVWQLPPRCAGCGYDVLFGQAAVEQWTKLGSYVFHEGCNERRIG
jgi:hypothetical protein